MKISPRATSLVLTAASLIAISACGGSGSSSSASPRTKNAALVSPNYGDIHTPPTAAKATTTTLAICGTAETSAQKASAIIEAQLVSEGIAQVVAQSASSAAAGSVERVGLLAKNNCLPAPTTTPTTLPATTTSAPSTATTKVCTTLEKKIQINGCSLPPRVWIKETTTTLAICNTAQTSAQKVSAIIEAQLVSEGIAQVVAQSAASAAAASVEQAGLLAKNNCITAPTTTSTSLVLTTTAPTTSATTISPIATTAPSTTEFKGPNFTKPTTCSQINRKLGKC
jgi:hypothetical protein